MSAVRISAIPEYEFHPIAEAFRLMNNAEFQSLCADIKVHGLYEPIWIYEGKILDGRNRYRACVDLGIPVTTRDFTGDSATEFSLSMNKERRQCTPSQLAVAALRLRPHFAEEAEKRQHQGRPPTEKEVRSGRTQDNVRYGKSISHVAKVVGVGATTVFKAERINREHPERIKEIEGGSKTLNAMYIELFESPPAESTAHVNRFESVREYKEHRVTAQQVIEKLLRDTEPVFRFGFWSVVETHIGTINAATAGDLRARAFKCRQQFSRLIQLLKDRSQS